MRILLCLLSEQHVPNLLSVHHFKPDRLVLIESAGIRRRSAAENLLAALKLGGLNCRTERAGGLSCRVELLEDENDLPATRRCIENVIRSEPPAEWIVNLTGGTKPMSIAAYGAFLDRDARLVYAPVNQPDCILDFRGGPLERCAYRPAVQEFLAGYGFQFAKVSELVAASERKAAERREAARVIARVVGSHALVHLDSDKEWNHCPRERACFQARPIETA